MVSGICFFASSGGGGQRPIPRSFSDPKNIKGEHLLRKLQSIKSIGTLALFVFSSVFLLTACTEVPLQSEWVTLDLPSGEAPLSAEEAGADYIQPVVPYAMVEDVDFALFSERWNEAATMLGHLEMKVDEFPIRYAVPGMRTEWDINGFAEGTTNIDYKTNNIAFPSIVMRWEDVSSADIDLLFDAWAILVYATNTGFDTKEELEYISEQMESMKLDLYETQDADRSDEDNENNESNKIETQEQENHGSHVISLNNIKYELWSDGELGIFRVIENKNDI